jgi:hypothetical protein
VESNDPLWLDAIACVTGIPDIFPVRQTPRRV